MTERSLHSMQHAYQCGNSVETALHHAVTRIEVFFVNLKFVLSIFLDNEGAFDKLNLDSNNVAAD